MNRSRQKKDQRLLAIAGLIITIFVGGVLLSNAPESWVVGDKKNYDDDAKVPTYWSEPVQPPENVPPKNFVSAKLDPAAHSKQRLENVIEQQFNDAAQLLQVRHYQQAITVLHKVLAQYPNMPEAHVNLGFAMFGLNELQKAVKSFNYALDIRPTEANAYYGLALVAEKENEYELAMGAMRSYLHLRKDDQYMGKARSALDYWENQLKVNSWKESADDQAPTESHK